MKTLYISTSLDEVRIEMKQIKEQFIINGAEAQSIDKQCIEKYGMPGMILMENAGRGIVDFMRAKLLLGTVVICCGGGNNGGDGLVVARHLDKLGIDVRVLLFAEPENLTVDAKINYAIVEKSQIMLKIIGEGNYYTVHEHLAKADYIVDALFGIGLKSQVRSPFLEVIQDINAATAQVIAVDVPSGLDCDSGEPRGVAVKADYTLAMIAIKEGFLKAIASEYLGQVAVVDIGAPRVCLEEFSLKR